MQGKRVPARAVASVAETLAEEPSSGETVRAMFAAENAKLRR